MKYSSILAVISLGALASAVLPQTVTDTVDPAITALNDVDDHQYEVDNMVLRAVSELGWENLNIPDAPVIVERLRRSFALIRESAHLASSAAAFLDNGRDNVRASTYFTVVFNDAANAVDNLAILAAKIHMDFLDLGMTLQDIEDNEDNRSHVADIFSQAENTTNELRKTALVAIDLARKAAAVCADLVDAAAHADVDSVAS